MSKDITRILEGWGYDPDEMVVRLVSGEDGRQKIQLRLELGLLQMEMDHRPDGTRPGGCESWLEYYEQKQQAYEAANPEAAAFSLDEGACGRLWREGVQYYHRYLSFWHLDLYELCARDTQRNLRLFAFICSHAADRRQKLQFDQWRPYVTMMHTRAVAMPLLLRKEHEEALRTIHLGIEAIEDFLEEYGRSDRAEECVELLSLQQWRDEILESRERAESARPKRPVEILRDKLDAAVAAEEFEEAARLRDEIQRLSTAEGMQ